MKNEFHTVLSMKVKSRKLNWEAKNQFNIVIKDIRAFVVPTSLEFRNKVCSMYQYFRYTSIKYFFLFLLTVQVDKETYFMGFYFHA